MVKGAGLLLSAANCDGGSGEAIISVCCGAGGTPACFSTMSHFLLLILPVYVQPKVPVGLLTGDC